MPDHTPHYGWRPAADGSDHQHVVIPGGPIGIHLHHAYAIAWCGDPAWICAGPNPHLDWTGRRRCMDCLPGWDRYTLLAGLSDAYPAGLTTTALMGVVPIDTPIEDTLGRLITAGQVTTSQDGAGTTLYHLTPSEAAIWASAGTEPAGIDLAKLNIRRRVGFACVYCGTDLDLLTRVYVTSAGQPQRHLYRHPDCPRGGESDG